MQSVCQVLLKDATGATVYSFASAGSSPCRLQVQNAGSIALIDSRGITWSQNAVPVGPAPNSGVLALGQTLNQARMPLLCATSARHC